MKGFREKCEKPPFLGILAQNGQFWTVFDQNGRKGTIFKKVLGTFFPPLQALTNCKVSEKSNKGIPKKMRYERADERGLNSRLLLINI